MTDSPSGVLAAVFAGMCVVAIATWPLLNLPIWAVRQLNNRRAR